MTKSPFRILLVEDNPHMLEMLAYGLQRGSDRYMPEPGLPVEIHTASDGQQAYSMLMAERYQLLVTDLYMPVMDGKQLITKVRADCSCEDLRILAISASTVSACDEALGCGADMFLRKPVRQNVLLDAVRDLLRGTQGVLSGPRSDYNPLSSGHEVDKG